METKDRFRLAATGKKWLKLEKALRQFSIIWSSSLMSLGPCQLWINDQLVLEAKWNPDRFRNDGWYGKEMIMHRNCPRKYYKQLVEFMKKKTNPEKAREFHDNGYWDYATK